MASKLSHRNRRAYKCLRCWHRDRTVYIEQRCRVLSHILKKHVTLDITPVYCTQCLFRCFTKEELVRHTSRFERHSMVLKEKGIVDSPSMLVENPDAPQIGDKDLVALSPEESLAHWEKASRKKDTLLQAVEEVFPGGIPSETPGNSFFTSPVCGDQQQAGLPHPSSPALLGPYPAQPEAAGTMTAESAQADMMRQLQQTIMGAFQPLLGALAQIPGNTAVPVQPEPVSQPEEERRIEEENILANILPSGDASPLLERERSPSPTTSTASSLSSSSSSSSSSASSSSSRAEDRKLLEEFKVAVVRNSQALIAQGAILNQLSEFLMKSGVRHPLQWSQATQTEVSRRPEKRRRSRSPVHHHRHPDPKSRLGWSRRR